MVKAAKDPADYILPLHINGLSGRMLRMLPPKGRKNEILYLYGHHSSLERYFGVAEYLNRYGGVTSPDLPGFGGMDPFYKIGKKPTLDNMADYLATFIKLRYKNKKFTIVGMSLGFMIVTRMLQKYPEICKNIDFVISQTGFTHHEDFIFKRRTYFLFRWGSSLFSNWLPSLMFKYVLFQPIFIRFGYKVVEPIFIGPEATKIRNADPAEQKRRIDFEVYLWKCNDARTYMDMALTMLKLDLSNEHIALPVYHIAMKGDRYFDSLRVEQHMRQIYSDFFVFKTHAPSHAPSIIATADEVKPFIPQSLINNTIDKSKKSAKAKK